VWVPDRLGMGLALTLIEERGPTETGPGRNAGTDHGTRFASDPGHANSRRLPPRVVRRSSPEGSLREVRKRQPSCQAVNQVTHTISGRA